MAFNDFGRMGIGKCCKDCKEKYEACHDHCEKYKVASKEWEEYKDKIQKAKKLNEYDLYRVEALRKAKKRRGL